MKSILKAATVVCFAFLGLLVFAVSDDQELFIESKESKTTTGGPVFNKIKMFKYKDKDVWMMNQSHHGSYIGANKWDRLAIVVDRTRSPKTARYYQLEPGPLEWQDGLSEKSFKVSCFICHNNGPRNIRPNYDSPFNPTGFLDRLKVGYWNLKIASYGRALVDREHDILDQKAMPPFRFRSGYENEPLQVNTCRKCHKESGFLARGSLRRQQVPTIKFMLESGQMPPLGFWLSSQEKKQLELFLDGF